MKVSCRYCGRTHEAGQTCTKKPKQKARKYYTEKDRAIRTFRDSGIWRRTREAVKERDYFCCRVCLELNCGTYKGRQVQTEKLSVHHIIPLAEDMNRATDLDNLITLCPLHHEDAEAGTITRKELQTLAKNKINLSPPRELENI